MAPVRRRRKKIVDPGQPLIVVGDGAAIPTKKDVGLFNAWRIAFFGSLAVVVCLIVFKPDPYLRIFAFVPDGIWVTFKVTVGSILLAVVIGLFTGLGRLSPIRSSVGSPPCMWR